ncbi:MAG TPA: hypothetical protein VMD02_07715 [Candidatus Omnitrophota bacterium]|nr:hypothetical protein [Candidatus Omnitrophota bacterium]
MDITVKIFNSCFRLPSAIRTLNSVRSGRIAWEDKGRLAFDFIAMASINQVPVTLNAQLKAEEARTEFADLIPKYKIIPIPALLLKQLEPAASIKDAVLQYIDLANKLKGTGNL